jgi:hypothetical protein
MGFITGGDCDAIDGRSEGGAQRMNPPSVTTARYLALVGRVALSVVLLCAAGYLFVIARTEKQQATNQLVMLQSLDAIDQKLGAVDAYLADIADDVRWLKAAELGRQGSEPVGRHKR